jgi:hypothetical protein
MNTCRLFGSVSTEQLNYHVTHTFLWEHGSVIIVSLKPNQPVPKSLFRMLTNDLVVHAVAPTKEIYNIQYTYKAGGAG